MMTDDNTQVWCVGTIYYSIIGWIGIVFFSFCGLMAWQSGQMNAIPLLIPIVMLDIVLLVIGGKVTVTSDAICHVTVYGQFQLSWEEITSVSVASGTLILEAAGKQLVLPSPEVWSGKEKRQAESLLVQQLQANGFLRIPRTGRTWAITRNCRL